MRTVTVVYHCEDGNWWADSPTPGLETFVAGGESITETRRLAEEGLEFYLGEEVRLDELFEPTSVVTYLETTHSDLPITVYGGPPQPGRLPSTFTLAPALPCAIAG